MCPQSTKTRSIRRRVYLTIRRLERTRADPKNSDRALLAGLAVSTFADVTGQDWYFESDPETILGDLLADLMHWTVAQQQNGKRTEPIVFESALDRARHHFEEEVEEESNESPVGEVANLQ